MKLSMKKIIAILLTLCMLSTMATFTVFAADDTAPADAAGTELAGIDSSMPVTLGEVYAVMAAYMTQYIPTENVKGMENVTLDAQSMDASMMASLMLYAKSVGLLTNDDMGQYNLLFKKKFDLNAPATRQEYAYILDRMINILSVQGINFAVPKPVSSSASVAKGSGNGAGTSSNIGGGDNGNNLTIDYYVDYQDLSGYAQKAFSFALSIGALQVKKYSDTKTVKLNFSDPFMIEKSSFLAPNDIITVGEIEQSLMAIMGLKLSAYTWQTVMTPPETIAVPETAVEAANVDSLLVLGDSISTGYGLKTSDDSYGAKLSAAFGLSAAAYNNLSVDGATSDALVAALKDPSDAALLENYNTIVITIGGNDVMGPFFALAKQALKLNSTATNADLQAAVAASSNAISTISTALLSNEAQFSAIVKTFGTNLTAIMTAIKTANPNAKIYIQTIYNPFSGVPGFETLSAGADTVISQMNAVISAGAQVGGYTVVDIYTAFKDNALLYTNISSLDIHPNEAGHKLIFTKVFDSIIKTAATASK
ncbi:MAG: SGNH/GDSL hydrolase family protein [Oscillospiraceae bacterium]|nr:SGNH/GDSL hydrolase family protein [Oscillospiraceae bacterium]